MAGFKMELTFDENGKLEKVKQKGKSDKDYKEWVKGEMPMELKVIESVIPLTIAHVHNSPGHWCLIEGNWYWCP